MYEYTVDRIILFFLFKNADYYDKKEEQKTKRKFIGKVRPTLLSGLRVLP